MTRFAPVAVGVIIAVSVMVGPGLADADGENQPVLPYGLKTAKALGLTIPPSLLLRADRVME